MASNRNKRISRVVGATGAAALLVTGLGQLSVASAAEVSLNASSKAKFNWDDASYIMTMRAGAVETYANIPRNETQDVGYTYVDLTHDSGAPTGRCEVESAAYWFGLLVENAVLAYGASPPGPDGQATTGYQNPTRAHTVNPDLTPNKDATTKPTLTSPSGDLWTAECDSDAKGQAASNVVSAAGVQVAGSSTSGVVDKKTGVYTGTSRAYVHGIEGAGDLDTITSLMQVRNEPDSEPTVTYRISFFDSQAGNSSFSQEGFSLSGTNVPANELVAQFNEQAKAGSAALAAMGPSGLQLLAPVVGKSQDGGRYSITAPAIAGYLGLTSRQGDIGQEQGVRFGSVTFTGDYGAL